MFTGIFFMLLKKNCPLLVFILIGTISTNCFGDLDKIAFLICAQNINEIRGEASGTSDNTLYPEHNIVKKHVRSFLEFDVFNREIQFLLKLKNFDHAPKLLYVDYESNTMYMEYAGEKLTKNNIPANWRSQLKEIIDGLKKRGVQHNDIKNNEVRVKDGKIMLIDYGWASEYGAPLPSNWPIFLGTDCRAPWGFDDRYSLTRIVLTTLNDDKKPEQDTVILEMKTIFTLNASLSFFDENNTFGQFLHRSEHIKLLPAHTQKSANRIKSKKTSHASTFTQKLSR